MEENTILEQEATLTPQQRLMIETRLTNEKKSVGVAYLLWFFLGGTGAQNFYVGRKVLAWVELGLLVCVLGACIAGGIVGAEVGEQVVQDAEIDKELAPAIDTIVGTFKYFWIPMIPLYLLLIYDLFTLPSAVKANTDKRRNELILAETGIKTNS